LFFASKDKNQCQFLIQSSDPEETAVPNQKLSDSSPSASTPNRFMRAVVLLRVSERFAVVVMPSSTVGESISQVLCCAESGYAMFLWAVSTPLLKFSKHKAVGMIVSHTALGKS